MKTSIHLTANHSGSALRDWWLSARVGWQRWRQRIRMRAELRAMDSRGLADIGMDPETASSESRKFFWQS
jgi:uncharacterized protein YjiS (DUF1127 family)